MSTTIIDPIGTPHPDVTVPMLNDKIYAWFAVAMGDMDKASELGDHEFYAGNACALADVMSLICNDPGAERVAEYAKKSAPVAVAAAKATLPLMKPRNIPFLIGLGLVLKR